MSGRCISTHCVAFTSNNKSFCLIIICNSKEGEMSRSSGCGPNTKLFTDALLRVFPPWPRDQLGRMATDEASVKALMSHALRHAGARCSSAFVRLPKRHQHTDTIQTPISNTRFLYPTCHLKGHSKLEREMAAANKLLDTSNEKRGQPPTMHRIWHRGQWRLVEADEEVESLSATEGRLQHNHRQPSRLWLAPKSVPLCHCVAADGPAVLHRWCSLEHHVHTAQIERTQIPGPLRSTHHYFATTGKQLPIPLERGSSETGGDYTIHTIKDMQAAVRERSDQWTAKAAGDERAAGRHPPLTPCWFLNSELPTQKLEIIAGRPVYHVALEEHHICIPLNDGCSVIDDEVRSGFLAAYPPPVASVPCAHVFLGETKEWRTCSLHELVANFGVHGTFTSSNEDVLLVNVATAEELGLVSWSDDTVRVREYFASPAAVVDEEDENAASESDSLEVTEHILDAISDEEGTDDAAQCATPWGEGRRTKTISTAMANAHSLPAHVLRELARVTTRNAPILPGPDVDATPLVLAEDTAGIMLVTVCKHLAVVNAADVQRVP
jgi:hypothetical protein